MKDLKNKKHHSVILQRAYNKYSCDFFRFNIIEFVKDDKDIIKREQFWIDKILVPDRVLMPVPGSLYSPTAPTYRPAWCSRKTSGSPLPLHQFHPHFRPWRQKQDQ